MIKQQNVVGSEDDSERVIKRKQLLSLRGKLRIDYDLEKAEAEELATTRQQDFEGQ